MKNNQVTGMLYLAEVKLESHDSDEITKVKTIVIANSVDDLAERVSYSVDPTRYKSHQIISYEKIRCKHYVVSKCIFKNKTVSNDQVKSGKESKPVFQSIPSQVDQKESRKYSIGISSTVFGFGEDHALRKLAKGIINSTIEPHKREGHILSDDSKLIIETVPYSSGYAKPRDVSNESNSAHFVRG